MAFGFQVNHKDSGSMARSGVLTAGGVEVPTPAFMPVGTQGVVKTVSAQDVWELGYRILLANAYHLYLRPGHGSWHDTVDFIHIWAGPALFSRTVVDSRSSASLGCGK